MVITWISRIIDVNLLINNDEMKSLWENYSTLYKYMI